MLVIATFEILRVIYINICMCVLYDFIRARIFHSNSGVTLLTCTREGKTRANINMVLHNRSICILCIIYMYDIDFAEQLYKGKQKIFLLCIFCDFPHNLRNKTSTHVPNA